MEAQVTGPLYYLLPFSLACGVRNPAGCREKVPIGSEPNFLSHAHVERGGCEDTLLTRSPAPGSTETGNPGRLCPGSFVPTCTHRLCCLSTGGRVCQPGMGLGDQSLWAAWLLGL